MSLIKCPECGKEISDFADSCIHCGYPINKKNSDSAMTGLCKACGTKNEATAMYCKDCGARLLLHSSLGVYSQYKQETETSKRPENWKTAIIVLCCLASPLTIIGIILMWLWEIPFKRDKRVFFTIVVLIYTAFFNLQAYLLVH